MEHDRLGRRTESWLRPPLAFGARLHDSLQARGPLCAGVDPHPVLLDAWGLPDTADGLAHFCDIAVQAFAHDIAVLKPQSAFFERFGSQGIVVLEELIGRARADGALVIADVKRGDIGSTAVAYGAAYLDPASALFSDAMTVNPFLGVETLRPLFDIADAHYAGVFVLALTSNPDAETFQRAVASDGREVARIILDTLANRNANAHPLGSFGAVIGATVKQTGHDLSTVNGPFLAPGIGAQGATATDLRVVFGSARSAVVPATSRGVLRAGPAVSALRDAALREREACARALGVD